MKNRKGFTLIELLVVIAIIGLLLGILVPVLGQVRRTAARTAGMANIVNIVKGQNVFAAKNKGWFAGLNPKGKIASADMDLPSGYMAWSGYTPGDAWTGKNYYAAAVTGDDGTATADPMPLDIKEANVRSLAMLLDSGEAAPAQLVSPGETNANVIEVESAAVPGAGAGEVFETSNSYAFLHWGNAALRSEWRDNTNQQAVMGADRVIYGTTGVNSVWSDSESGEFLGAVVRGDTSGVIETIKDTSVTGFLTNLRYGGKVCNSHTGDGKTAAFSVWGRYSDDAGTFGAAPDATTGADALGKVGTSMDTEDAGSGTTTTTP